MCFMIMLFKSKIRNRLNYFILGKFSNIKNLHLSELPHTTPTQF